jgi:Na+/citrate or Na+/malate symporter
MSILLTVYPYGIDDLTGLIAAVLIFSFPIMIAILVYRHKVNATNKRTQIILTALEKNEGSVPEELLKSLNEPKKSTKERLLWKLLWGILGCLTGLGLIIATIVEYYANQCFDTELLIYGLVVLAAGVAFLVYYFVGRRALQAEIEAEEQKKKNVIDD